MPSILPGFGDSKSQPTSVRVELWLHALRRDRSHAELAESLGVNRNTIARWLNGTSEPRLPQLLAFIQCTTQRVIDFIAELVDPSLVPSISLAYRDLTEQRELAYSAPWSHAVLRALETDTYRALVQHKPGVLAALTGLSVDEENRCLNALRRAKQIYKARGRYRVHRVLTVDTSEDAARNLALKRHWFGVAHARLEQLGVPTDGLASYNVFAIPEADLARVRAAQLDYYERLRVIVADSRQPTRVVLVTLGLFPLDQAGGLPDGPGSSSAPELET
jgi:transcriptional regulator with XRE-family HTH domain